MEATSSTERMWLMTWDLLSQTRSGIQSKRVLGATQAPLALTPAAVHTVLHHTICRRMKISSRIGHNGVQRHNGACILLNREISSKGRREDKMIIHAMGEVDARVKINAAKEVAASPCGYVGVGYSRGLRAEALQWQRL